MKMLIFFVVVLSALSGGVTYAKQPVKKPNVNEQKLHAWLESTIKPQALAQGMTLEQWQQVAKSIHFVPKVIKLDRAQPEGKKSWVTYRDSAVTPSRIAKGRELIKQHQSLLTKISQDYGVPVEIIVALWGIETNFGQNVGTYYVPSSLATLAYEGRRREFFTKELLIALDMLRQNQVTQGQFKGSWAGAMGQCQFMPSSYEKYAVDYDGDGKKDIWQNQADIFASIANYLKSEGWDKSVPWGMVVTYDGDAQQQAFVNNIRLEKSLQGWIDFGIKITESSKKLDDQRLMVLLAGPQFDNNMFLVYKNFFVLRHWNKSDYFCLAVGLLSDGLKQ